MSQSLVSVITQVNGGKRCRPNFDEIAREARAPQKRNFCDTLSDLPDQHRSLLLEAMASGGFFSANVEQLHAAH